MSYSPTIINIISQTKEPPLYELLGDASVVRFKVVFQVNEKYHFYGIELHACISYEFYFSWNVSLEFLQFIEAYFLYFKAMS